MALKMSEWNEALREALEAEDRLVNNGVVDGAITTRVPVAADDEVVQRMADVLAEVEIPDEGAVVVWDGRGLPTAKACLLAGKSPRDIVVVNQNVVDFAYGLRTAADRSEELHKELRRVRGHPRGLGEACEDLLESGVGVAAVLLNAGLSPSATADLGVAALSSGALCEGALLACIPSVSELRRHGGKEAVRAAVQGMLDELLAAADDHGYAVEVDDEASDLVGPHACILRIEESPADVPERVRPAPAVAAAVQELLEGSGLLLPPGSRQCWVKHTDAALSLHLRRDCSGARRLLRRSQAPGTEECKKCLKEAAQARSLYRMLTGRDHPGPAAQPRSPDEPQRPPQPVPTPGNVDSRQPSDRTADTASSSYHTARSLFTPSGGHEQPLWKIGSGKCYHWSRECRHMRKDGQKTQVAWREGISAGLKPCSHCPGTDPTMGGHAPPASSAHRWEPEPERVQPAHRPAPAHHGGGQDVWQIGSGKCYHWSRECRHMSKGGAKTALSLREAQSASLRPCSHCPGTDPAVGGHASSAPRWEPEPEPEPVRPAPRPAPAAHGGGQDVWQIGSGKRYHWSRECRHMSKGGAKTALSLREAQSASLRPCSHCPGTDPAVGGHAPPVHRWEPEPEPEWPARRPAPAHHGGGQDVWQIGSGKCYHWSRECRHMSKGGATTALSLHEAQSASLRPCSHCPGTDPAVGGHAPPVHRWEPEPEPERPAHRPAQIGGRRAEVQLLQCGSGKKVHWSFDCQFVKAARAAGTLQYLSLQDVQAGGFDGACSKCSKAEGSVPSALQQYM